MTHLTNAGYRLMPVELTLTISTSQYADGDIMSNPAELTGAVRTKNGVGEIVAVEVLDVDDEGAAFDIWLVNTGTAWGTINDAINLSDALAADVRHKIPIAAGDYYDLGGARVAVKNGIVIPFKAALDTTSIYVATVARGTPTYAAATDVSLRFWIRQY